MQLDAMRRKPPKAYARSPRSDVVVDFYLPALSAMALQDSARSSTCAVHSRDVSSQSTKLVAMASTMVAAVEVHPVVSTLPRSETSNSSPLHRCRHALSYDAHRPRPYSAQTQLYQCLSLASVPIALVAKRLYSLFDSQSHHSNRTIFCFPNLNHFNLITMLCACVLHCKCTIILSRA